MITNIWIDADSCPLKVRNHVVDYSAKKGINVDNLKFDVNFDLAIKMKNKSYVTNITLNMPCGENLIKEGTTSEEITEGFIFRRVKI